MVPDQSKAQEAPGGEAATLGASTPKSSHSNSTIWKDCFLLASSQYGQELKINPQMVQIWSGTR